MPAVKIQASNGETVSEIQDSITTIGRGETNIISLTDPKVEPRHCQIARTPDGRSRVVDLNTRSGMKINGREANFRVLEDRDEIQIGTTKLTFLQDATDTGEISRPSTLKFRLRRKRFPRRRRVVLPKERKGPRFDIDDLSVVIESLVEEHGIEALDEARRIFDEVHESHTGTPLFESLSHDRENLFKLIELIKVMNTQHELQSLLESIMDQAIGMTGAERGFLVLLEKKALSIRVARNFDREEIEAPENKISRTISQQVIQTGSAVLSQDAMTDSQLPASESVTELKLRSLVCVPFRFRDRVIGCVYLDNRIEPNMFTEDDLPILQAFADQAAIAIENAQLYGELNQSKDELQRLNRRLKDRVERQYEEFVKVREDLMNTALTKEHKYDYSKIIGQSRPMQDLFMVMDKVVDQSTPVLILGDSGTGKELVARAIHSNGPRKERTFVSQNCAAIPESLLESELFGHEKGAFTGAISSKPGLFERADTGTLFLDEIADMSLEMQAKLLRAIEYGEIRRVGGQQSIKVDVRLLSATNKNLKTAISEGRFREDLYYRINVVTLELPPLRDRRDDIPLLVEHFVEKLARREGKPKKQIDDATLWALRNYEWPGNIRELENEVHRAWAMSEGTITLDALREDIRQQPRGAAPVELPREGGLKEMIRRTVEDLERKVIAEALTRTGWKKSETARLLGISRPTLDAKISDYNITKPS